MKKIFVFLLLLAVSLPAGCGSKDLYDYINTDSVKIDVDSIEIDELDEDYLFLCKAPFFAYDGVGDAGEIPEQVKAFGRLFRKENARDYFVKMEAEANNEGKLYALCGLFYFEYEYYYKLLKEYENNENLVTTMGGCIMADYPIKEEIKSDSENAVRLINNKDTIDNWAERMNTTEFTFDFYGGSIPCVLKENALEG